MKMIEVRFHGDVDSSYFKGDDWRCWWPFEGAWFGVVNMTTGEIRDWPKENIESVRRYEVPNEAPPTPAS